MAFIVINSPFIDFAGNRDLSYCRVLCEFAYDSNSVWNYDCAPRAYVFLDYAVLNNKVAVRRESEHWHRANKQAQRQQEADRLAAISALIPIMKGAAELAGFEVVGRITLKDKATGKEYR